MKRMFLLILGVILLAGCDRMPTGKVSGTVWWKGKPVEYGRIEFVPAGDRTLPTVSAEIHDGKYSAEVPCGEVVLRLYKLEKFPTRYLYGKEIPDSQAFQNVLLVEDNDTSTKKMTIQKGVQNYDYP
ncbi:MAG: hypothetical protein Q4D62_01070 [Planctomycetia bacterium]|nr:hypothetical protein [Planctomycetia bacterium]